MIKFYADSRREHLLTSILAIVAGVGVVVLALVN